jgi:hypothetical protein
LGANRVLLKRDSTDGAGGRCGSAAILVGVLVEDGARGSPRQELRLLAQGPWPQILAVDLLMPAVECIENGDAGYFLTSFAATSVTALQVNSTKS